MINDDLNLVAASEFMLKNGYGVFSKKQHPDTGDWWLMINRSTVVDLLGREVNAELRIRGDGATLFDAVEDAFRKAGVYGLSWSLAKLDVRMRTLRDMLNGPEAKPQCKHGVSGGKCRECV